MLFPRNIPTCQQLISEIKSNYVHFVLILFILCDNKFVPRTIQTFLFLINDLLYSGVLKKKKKQAVTNSASFSSSKDEQNLQYLL